MTFCFLEVQKKPLASYLVSLDLVKKIRCFRIFSTGGTFFQRSLLQESANFMPSGTILKVMQNSPIYILIMKLYFFKGPVMFLWISAAIIGNQIRILDRAVLENNFFFVLQRSNVYKKPNLLCISAHMRTLNTLPTMRDW